MDERDKALQLIRMKGPVVPSNISKELEKNILFTSVILAELVSAKQLKVSNVKIGSSPLYYLPGQESRLELFYKYLNEKDRRTFELLREKKVMREKDQEPLIRVSLSQIKDFAVPLNVTIKGEKEVFYKWHSLSNEDATQSIRDLMSPKKEIEEQSLKEVNELKEEKEAPKEEPKKEEPKEVEKEEVPKAVVKEEPKAIEKPKVEERPKEEVSKEVSKEEPKKESAERAKENVTEKPVEKKDAEQKTLSAIEEPSDALFKKAKEFFRKNEIAMIGYEIFRKGKVYDCDIKIKTGVGELPYLCRVQDKKWVSDSDIASGFVQAQMKKLPLLFLTTGELTKKTKEMMGKEFKSVTFVKLQ